jgi:PKD repeat protein
VGISEFTVTVTQARSPVNGARVCLHKEDDVYQIENTGQDGTASFTVSPFTHGALNVTVIKQDYLPFVDSSYVEAVAPTCDFEGIPTLGVQPLSVEFGDLSNGSIDSWMWDFGDGTGDSVQNPVHVYDTAGTFDVSLYVDGPYGSESELKAGYITVTAPADSAWLVPYPEHRDLEAYVGDTLEFRMMLANHADSAHSVMYPLCYDLDALELLTLEIDTSSFPNSLGWHFFEMDTIAGDSGKVMLYAWTSAYPIGLPHGPHRIGSFTLLALDSAETRIDTCFYPPQGHMYYTDGRGGMDYWPYWRPVDLSISVQNPDSAWLSLDPSGDPMTTELALHGDESTELHMMIMNLSDSAHSVMYPLRYDVNHLEFVDLSCDTTAFPMPLAWNIFEFDTICGDTGKLMIYGWTNVYSIGITPGVHRIGILELRAVMPDSDSLTCVIDTCTYPPAGHLYYSNGPAAEDYWPDWFPLTVTIYRALCGDANGDETVTTGDGFQILNYFGAGPSVSSCWAANVDGQGGLSPADGFHLLNFFGAGPGLNCQACEVLTVPHEHPGTMGSE